MSLIKLPGQQGPLRSPPTSSRSGALAAASLALLASIASATPAPAQLRPLDPVDWSLMDGDDRVRLEIGAGFYDGQRASLAGVEGQLWELGIVELAWRTGRVVLEADGTLFRRLDPQRRFVSPCCGASGDDRAVRVDAGDVRLSTFVSLAEGARGRVGFRFGTQLPTTDNRVGLERDLTDFFALVGAQGIWQRTRLSVELGLGINGTRETDFEQSDELLYSAELRRRFGLFESALAVVGQMDGLRKRTIRGNEDLDEVRLALRAGKRYWLEAELIWGTREFSPDAGLRLGLGAIW